MLLVLTKKGKQQSHYIDLYSYSCELSISSQADYEPLSVCETETMMGYVDSANQSDHQLARRGRSWQACALNENELLAADRLEEANQASAQRLVLPFWPTPHPLTNG